MAATILVLTDNVFEQRFLEAILRHQPYREALEFESGLGGTSILTRGSSRLLRDPARPIAMVLNSETEQPGELAEIRESIDGYMSFCSKEYWTAVLAIPRLDAWALADERIRGIFEGRDDLRTDRYNQSVAMSELTDREAFDVEALRRSSEDFRRLDAFLTRKAGSSARRGARSGRS